MKFTFPRIQQNIILHSGHPKTAITAVLKETNIRHEKTPTTATEEVAIPIQASLETST